MQVHDTPSLVEKPKLALMYVGFNKLVAIIYGQTNIGNMFYLNDNNVAADNIIFF